MFCEKKVFRKYCGEKSLRKQFPGVFPADQFLEGGSYVCFFSVLRSVQLELKYWIQKVIAQSKILKSAKLGNSIISSKKGPNCNFQNFACLGKATGRNNKSMYKLTEYSNT